MPIEIEILETIIDGRPGYTTEMILYQTLLFPPIVCFAFATVTPMFWFGPLYLRFAASMAMLVPGVVGFFLLLALIQGIHDINGEVTDVTSVLFVYFIAISSVAIAVQFWTPWTLTHLRTQEEALTQTNLSSMIQLTMFAALGFALIRLVDSSDILNGMIFFGALGLLMSLVCISVLRNFLVTTPRTKMSRVVAISTAGGISFVFNAFMLYMSRGSIVTFDDVVLIVFPALYGVMIVLVVAAVCVKWLRVCGWSCVNRRQVGLVNAAE